MRKHEMNGPENNRDRPARMDKLTCEKQDIAKLPFCLERHQRKQGASHLPWDFITLTVYPKWT